MTGKPAEVVLVERFTAIRRALNQIEGADPDVAADALQEDVLPDAIALVQEFRDRLAKIEVSLTTVLGKRVGKNAVGNLSDGRQYEVKRGGERTSWDHEDWRRDVRRVVVDRIQAVDPQVPVEVAGPEGEVWEVPLVTVVQNALMLAQEVHGASAPKTTALRELGLWADDYCTKTPGPWKLSVVKPSKPSGPGVLRVVPDLD